MDIFEVRSSLTSARKPAIRALVGLTIIVGLFGACTTGTESNPPSPTTALSGPSATSAQVAELPQGDDPVDLDPADFTTEIDNPYWPMVPGTRSTYLEIDEKGRELTVVVIVTHDTKMIANGITARVVRDTVTRDGEIIEDTNDWYAQDAEGNIWYLGEDTAEFKNGKITTRDGSFEAGVDGALPGIAVPADPQPGMTYRQEYYKGQAEDNGEVLSTEEMADVIFGHFDNMLLTKDTITIEPDVLEYKLYAPGYGAVLIFDVSGGAGREELVKVDKAPASAGTGPLGSPNA